MFIVLVCGCESRTKADDIILKKNQALYHFVIYGYDEKTYTEWIRPHLTSLTGKHIRTKNFRAIAGDSFEVIRIVEFVDSVNIKELRSENKKVFDSLRKKAKYKVELRSGI
jgi:hypothetical protein